MPMGQVIRQRRLDLGLTQEQLSEGICDVVTLSRLENGRQEPTRGKLRALLQRLGLPDDHYYVLGTAKEQEQEMLEKEIVSCNVQYSRTLGEEKERLRQAGLEKLRELETLLPEDDTFTRQLILRSRVILGRADGPYSPEEQLDLLLRAIRLTVPRFAPDTVADGLYGFEEVKIINQLGITYAAAGQRETAVCVLGQLFTYIRTHFRDISCSAGHLPLVAFNYARELDLSGRWREALEVAQVGRGTCIDYGHYEFLPDLIAIMAECRYRLGDERESRALYHQAYYLYGAVGDESNREIICKEAEEYLGLEFEY